MKIICVGNYIPRQCGIATFTENLIRAILKAADLDVMEVEAEVIAMNDHGQEYSYPEIVSRTISDSVMEQYIETADYINNSGAQICLLQHEYGIFGGDSGLLILALLRRLKIPVITTCHTVLKKPGFHQQEVMNMVCQYSSRIVVMSNLSREIIHNVYHVPLVKIALIEHGVPDFNEIENLDAVRPELWKDRLVLFTFGLIGRNKGIETVIRALPAIVSKHPEVLYVVLGKTHPNVVRNRGEEYREFLKKLVDQLALSQNVIFINKYISETDLMGLLKASDIYITPYLNQSQITSGTLSYAVAGGCAVLSTPYWHAVELLDGDRGLIFPFENYYELANLVNHLIENPERMEILKKNASDYGKAIIWPKIGKAYLKQFQEVIDDSSFTPLDVGLNRRSILPDFDITHLERLTDNTGLLQHASTCVPSYKTGYCLDDNSRALIVCIRAWKDKPRQEYESLIIRYLSYIRMMQRKDGSFNNFLTYERVVLVDNLADDAFGRTIWALGYLIRYAPNDSLLQSGLQMFSYSLNQIQNLHYARDFANCIFGLYHYIKRFPDQDQYLLILEKLADQLCKKYHELEHDDWNWFEKSITYDNGLLPASLYKAYSLTRKPEYLAIADKTAKFLESKCIKNGWLSLIGNHRWLRLNEDYDLFAQQPIDALAMMIMYESAWSAKNDKSAIQKLLLSYDWFFGRNDLNIPVYDEVTKGCNDGIEEFNINRNQGAESTIAYLWSRQIAGRHTTC